MQIKFDPLYETSAPAVPSNELPERSAISPQDQWKTEDIFPDDPAWENAFKELESALPEISQHQGKLGKSAEHLLACLTRRETLEVTLGKLYLYAGLRNDQDTRATHYQALRSRITSLLIKFRQASAFIQPEILAIPEEKLRQFMANNDTLKNYQHTLEDILRSKPHTLSSEQEKLLAMTGELSQGPYHIFSMFNNADIKFPTIRDEKDNPVELTKGRYSKFMESTNRRVRKDAFKAMYETYGQWTNTLAATLSTAIKRNIFYANARNYPNALEASLDSDNIPVTVYSNVIETVNQNLAPLHRYMHLRKKRLAIAELSPWDLQVPLFNEVSFSTPYQEARSMVQKALTPLGDPYLKVLNESFENGWIDVHENRGKRSGAYSWSTYGVHPYILLNYNETLNDVFTLAHELGHALHSHHTQMEQPSHYSHYTIFVAEVASTLNEALLIDYLLKNTDTPQKKLYLLNEYVDKIYGTVYIQTLFAEFEKYLHETTEAGQALTAENLSEFCGELYQRFLGPAFTMPPEFSANWCRIPHFYYNFYVYQYVTGFSAATALSQKIISGDIDARDAYLKFLSRGCADYSINLLKDAGVDMTSPAPIEAATRLMDQLLDEIETLLS